jgi:hypothetical protein
VCLCVCVSLCVGRVSRVARVVSVCDSKEHINTQHMATQADPVPTDAGADAAAAAAAADADEEAPAPEQAGQAGQASRDLDRVSGAGDEGQTAVDQTKATNVRTERAHAHIPTVARAHTRRERERERERETKT